MTNKQIDAIDIELHSEAVKLITDYVDEFAINLLLESKIIARQRKLNMVHSINVEDAFKNVTKNNKVTWSREISIILGSALFGAFIQGFINEVSSGNTALIIVYTILGFLGMGLVFWALR